MWVDSKYVVGHQNQAHPLVWSLLVTQNQVNSKIVVGQKRAVKPRLRSSSRRRDATIAWATGALVLAARPLARAGGLELPWAAARARNSTVPSYGFLAT